MFIILVYFINKPARVLVPCYLYDKYINIYLLGKKSALVNLHSKLLICKLKVKRLGILTVS